MTEPSTFWKKKGARLCRLVNITLWAEYFAPGFFLIAAIGALLLYAFRRWEIHLLWAAAFCCLGMVIVAYLSYIKRKREFFGRREAFALIDYQLGLQSSLSAASEGQASWPEAGKTISPLRWRSPMLFLWIPFGLLLIGAALILPLPQGNATPPPVWEKPPAVAAMENWIETLEQIKELHQENIEQFEEKLEELNGRSAEEMYSHAALEAADSLEGKMKMDLQSFAQNLNSLDKALSEMLDGSMDRQSAQFDQQALQHAMQALDSMKEQGMQLSEGSCNNPGEGEKNEGKEGGKGNSPKALTSDQISSLSKEQLQNLQNSLGNVASEMQKLNIAELEGLLRNGNEGKEGEEDGKEGPGKGGASRGKGDAPLTLDEKAPELNLTAEGLERDPNAKVVLGEKIGEETGTHEAADSSRSKPGSTGSVSSPSSGGQAVWTDQFTPAEREALKDFFK